MLFHELIGITLFYKQKVAREEPRVYECKRREDEEETVWSRQGLVDIQLRLRDLVDRRIVFKPRIIRHEH